MNSIKNKMFNKRNIMGLLILLSSNAFADPILNDKKAQALNQLESAFASSPTQMTTVAIPNQVNWPSSGLDMAISNLGQVVIGSKYAVTINKISVTLNGVTVVNPVELKLKANTRTKYQLPTADFIKNDLLLHDNYKLLGIVKQISADDFIGYHDYYYHIVKVTLDFTNNSGNYSQTLTNFILVVGK